MRVAGVDTVGRPGLATGASDSDGEVSVEVFGDACAAAPMARSRIVVNVGREGFITWLGAEAPVR